MLSYSPYQVSHRDELIAVFRSNMPVFFLDHELPQFIQFLNEPGPYFVQEWNGQVIGSGGYYLNPDDTVSLCWGMVHRQFHGTGKGRALLEFRLRCISEHYPKKNIVLVTSQHSISFFEQYGFRLLSVKKDSFGQGLDECRMALIS